MNTINLNQSQFNNSQGVPSIVITPRKIEIPTKQEKEGCVKCSTLPQVKCSDKYFSVKNLFSELTDDYQRAIIRQNLGIHDGSSMVWGKIEGNLANQKDLANFIAELLNKDQAKLLDTINLELKYWTLQIENKIESLASNIRSIDIVPKYGISNQLPIDVLVTWEYENEVQAQAINGIALEPDVRSYIFENVNDSLDIRLAYCLDDTWLARNMNFEVSFPTFYGVSSDPSEDDYTIKNKFKVNAGENQYIYVITRNESNLSVNGLIGGFVDEGIIYVSQIRYFVYKSVQPNLGETTIIINDKE